jgi:hypothetical protein
VKGKHITPTIAFTIKSEKDGILRSEKDCQ